MVMSSGAIAMAFFLMPSQKTLNFQLINISVTRDSVNLQYRISNRTNATVGLEQDFLHRYSFSTSKEFAGRVQGVVFDKPFLTGSYWSSTWPSLVLKSNQTKNVSIKMALSKGEQWINACTMDSLLVVVNPEASNNGVDGFWRKMYSVGACDSGSILGAKNSKGWISHKYHF